MCIRDRDTLLTVAVGTGVLFNDTDQESDTITVVRFDASSANGGTVAVAADGSFTYDPAPDFNGTDTFTYEAIDLAGSNTSSNTATVTIDVAAINDPPDAVDDGTYNATEDTLLTVAVGTGVLFNDSDPESDAFEVNTFDASSANGGTVAVAADGSFTYDPAPDFNGTDTFTYEAIDLAGSNT